MTEARVSLILACLSLIVAGAAFWLPFYYQYLRRRHDLGFSILGYSYDTKVLTIRGAFVNRGTEDEVVLDWSLIVSAKADERSYKFMPFAGDVNVLSNPYGMSHFVVHHGEASVKRLEWAVTRGKLPGEPDGEQPMRGKKTYVGLAIRFLDTKGQPGKKVFYFGAVTEADMPGGLEGGGTAEGTVTARISPTSVVLLKE